MARQRVSPDHVEAQCHEHQGCAVDCGSGRRIAPRPAAQRLRDPGAAGGIVRSPQPTPRSYPKDVIVRMSDFKSNEYANLIGGRRYEPVEENPMIGFRGASRYYDPRYQAGFALECRAMTKVRDEMALTNVKLMIPSAGRSRKAARSPPRWPSTASSAARTRSSST